MLFLTSSLLIVVILHLGATTNNSLSSHSSRLHLILSSSVGQDLISLLHCQRWFVNFRFIPSFVLLLIALQRHIYYLHHILLQRFLLQLESVFVPDEIGHFRIMAILLHATFKETNDIFVVWILSELELSAVVHEFLELLWVTFAQFLNRHF